MKRRPFLEIIGGAVGSYTVGLPTALASENSQKSDGVAAEIPKRELKRVGVKVPMVCFPGLALNNYNQETCNQAIHRILAQGWNYLDVAPAYGEAEVRMGIALQGIERNRYFLACKTKKRDKAGARSELERSLKRLQTDHFDLYQFHHLRTVEEVEQIFGPGGAMETFKEAQAEGKIRSIGFSSHTTKSALAALNRFSFDTVMFPINFLEYHKFGFGKEVVELAEQQGASVLAMKTISGGLWPPGMENPRKWWYRPLEDQKEIDSAVRFSLSQKAVAAVVPTSFIDLFEKTTLAAKSYQPLTESESEQLKALAQKYDSVFLEQQKQLSMADRHPGWAYPDCPFDCDSHWS